MDVGGIGWYCNACILIFVEAYCAKLAAAMPFALINVSLNSMSSSNVRQSHGELMSRLLWDLVRFCLNMMTVFDCKC